MKIKIHPFDFLQNVVYNVKIKPLNKRFEKLGGQEYEEIVEYFKNPDNFIKNEKRKLRENSVEFLYKEFKEIKKILEKRKNYRRKNKVIKINLKKNKVGHNRIINSLNYLNNEFKNKQKNIFNKAWDWMNSKINKNENKEKFDSEVYFKFKKELLNIDKNIKSFYKLKEAIEIVISEEIKGKSRANKLN
ncbi:unnamed protein product [Meloidogyne enterolobii]|uniref:Uncharacterized protein n=1 Tax=Meloidogyne enterolobii TaxID=390850 RepID=A0ACB0ZKF7_MELEN